MDEELEALVNELIAKGESQAVIDSVIDQWDSANNPMPQGATAGMLPASNEQGDPAVGPFKQPQPAEQVLRSLGSYVKEHPVATAVTAGSLALGMPLAGRAAAALAPGRPAIAAGVTKLGQMINHPAAAGAIGAVEGGRRGGLSGAVTGGAAGYGSARVLGMGLEKLGGAIAPKPAILSKPLAPPRSVAGVNPVARLEGGAAPTGEIGRLPDRMPAPPPRTPDADLSRMVQHTPMESTRPQANPFAVESADVVRRRQMNQGGTLVDPNAQTVDEGAEAALRELLAEGPMSKWNRQTPTSPQMSPEGVTDPALFSEVPKVAPYKQRASTYQSDAPRGERVPTTKETITRKLTEAAKTTPAQPAQPATPKPAVTTPAQPGGADDVAVPRRGTRSKDKSPVPGLSWNDVLDRARRYGISTDEVIRIELEAQAATAARATANYGRAKAGAETLKNMKQKGGKS